MDLKPHYDFRKNLVRELVRDLVGPSDGDEVIEDRPLTRYGAGVLYPQGASLQAEENDMGAVDDEQPDPPVALANLRYPSSMGMTFALDTKAASAVDIHVETARYVRCEDPDGVDSAYDAPARPGARRARRAERWQRQALGDTWAAVDVTRPRTEEQGLGIAGLQVFFRVRPADERGCAAVTVILVNTNRTAGNQPPGDADAFFQSKLTVTAPEGRQPVFTERPTSGRGASDDDLRAYRLLYRHAKEFAVGHGCSVEWEVDAGDPNRAVTVSTTYVPSYPLPLADSNPAIRLTATAMKHLARSGRDEILEGLRELCGGYDDWIRRTRDTADADASLDPQQRETAQTHLQLCGQAAARMRKGVELLGAGDESNPAWRAFRLMNEAMLKQRARSVWLRGDRGEPGPVESSDHQWRPFQLAFILLCLEGIVDPESDDRNIADLLWFPTGGGKTEAYLGLIAFTVFLRRLRKNGEAGVTAIMRYTLRLLTIQQFERASMLICSCEAIRRGNASELGSEPISIGMWLGSSATPNSLHEAKAALRKLEQGADLNEGNPVQIQSCPWCGQLLDHRHYKVLDNPPVLRVGCGNTACEYGGSLPAYLIDQDVYKYRPTLIIATVDKFASLPWREECAALFNLPERDREGWAPPELIIQDELHLISGPLGTLTGLYETAVDALCTDAQGRRPKVVASTATIRRAADQGKSLFDREVRQFPPSGIDARDSYFAVEAPPDKKGTRMYVGVLAPGISHTTLLVRAYAALLQGAAEVQGADDVRDAYWTLVGYFNSLRVLGGARMQVQDDVPDRMELLARQRGRPRRQVSRRIELTSREASSDIPRYLKQMELPYGAPEALDVILATNMISVGVDIDRLGLMAVMGQPQSTSEYIQSTSRVGRKYPGLVTVLFNAARSRDRSHYESFIAYHSAIYRQVESTSVTPFSPRARDRGLHGVLIGLARLLAAGYRANTDAGRITSSYERLDRIKEIIRKRVAEVDKREQEATMAQLDEILELWRERADGGPLVYRDRDTNKALLVEAGSTDPGEAFPTLWSLRDVDAESNLYLVRDRTERGRG